jgi:hypothetical protein
MTRRPAENVMINFKSWDLHTWLIFEWCRVRRMVPLDAVHRYYCEHCQQAVFGGGPVDLANAVNRHNEIKHPMEFAGWKPDTIVISTHYSGPAEPPSYLVPYMQKENLLPGSVKTAKITDGDRDWLAKNKVRWED